MLSIHLVLLLLALIAFMLAAAQVVVRVNLVALGLAFWVLAAMLR